MSTRYERVVLDLEDKLSPGMARAAASTALLNRELGSLSRDSVRTRRSVSDIDQPVGNLGRTSGNASREVDKLSGRMRILADMALILGPSLIPIGAVGVPAVTGLAAQLGFAAAAGGTAILAFQGIGNALKTLNTAALTPTTENLQKAQVALEGLSPEAQKFVAQLGTMIPELHKLRDVAAGGLFPGATEGLRSMETALPHVQGVIAAIAGELGKIAGDAGASLASPKWTDFLDFIAKNAPQALGEMAQAAGNTAHAVAALWMATDPLNDNFSKWLVDATADLDRWATGLSKTQGFEDFIAYVDTNGPKVAAAFGAIANAALQIVQAAAPLGGPVLEGIKALADMVAALANSDIGTPLFTAAAALALFNRTLAITGALQKSTFGSPAVASIKGMGLSLRGLSADLALVNRQSALMSSPGKGFIGPLTQAQTAMGRIKASAATFGKTAALIGGIGVASSGAADKIGLTNAASLALMGTFIAPGWGTAIGGAAGLLLDAKDAGQGFADAMEGADRALKSFDTSTIEAQIKALQKQRDDLTHVSGVGDFFSDRVTKALHPGAFSSKAVNELDNKIQQLKGHLTFTREQAQQALLRDGFIATSDGIKTATQSTREFQTSLQKLNETLSGRASMRDYEQALDDFTKRAADRAKLLAKIAEQQRVLANPKSTAAQKQAATDQIKSLQAQAAALKNSLDIGTQAGRDTQALLDNIAATALKVATSLTGTKRTEFLAGARSDFVAAAKAAGMANDEAQKLADKVLGLSQSNHKVKIVVDADGAWHVIDLTAARLERLTRKTYKINIKAQAAAVIPQVLDAQAHADGGTVRGQRHPYGDKVLALLAPTEEVITNRHGEADRFRADRAAGRIPAYADGGTVRMAAHASTGRAGGDVVRLSPDDIGQIVRGLATVRPIADHITLMPHNYSEWERQQAKLKRAAGIGGVGR